jgi:hypothetical protein
VKFNDVNVTVAQTLPLNVSMTVGSVVETVVNAQTTAPAETESTQVSNLVDAAKIKALPLITRNPYELVLLSPDPHRAMLRVQHQWIARAQQQFPSRWCRQQRHFGARWLGWRNLF